MMRRPRSSSSYFVDLRNRELSGSKVWQRSYLADISSDSSSFIIEHERDPSIPLALSFCKTSRSSHILAVSDEEGYVSLYNTRKDLTGSYCCSDKTAEAKVYEWVAHENAVYDICWIKDDSQLLTASADKALKLWDAESRRCIGRLTGHTATVKSVCSHSSNSDLFISGSRDGSFALWDLRCNNGSTNSNEETLIKSTNVVKEAHVSSQGRKSTRRKAISKSVTAVLYLKDDISIASAGAADSVVKLWDARNLKASICQAFPDIKSPSKMAKSPHGISCLSQDSTGVFLAASCRDSRVYLYDLLHLSKGPIKIFTGSKISSFYVKSEISSDGSHILGGSGDGNAYIWSVNNREDIPLSLKAHEDEVTAVAWCSSEVAKLATTSDDCMVRIWKMKEGSFSTRSPISMRRRITAPQIMQCRKINSEETQSDSGFISETSCAHKEAMSPSSPQAKLLEFKTPESMNKRRRHGLLFSMRERELLSPPDFTSDSPSSVLDPPPSSSKRKTIRDYFTAS